MRWEGPNFLQKQDIKVNSHENVSIEFENFNITETSHIACLKPKGELRNR